MRLNVVHYRGFGVSSLLQALSTQRVRSEELLAGLLPCATIAAAGRASRFLRMEGAVLIAVLTLSHQLRAAGMRAGALWSHGHFHLSFHRFVWYTVRSISRRCCMSNEETLQLFEDQPIRTAWSEADEEWYFSVVDVVSILTDQPDVRHAAKYWSVLKSRLKKEGSQLPTNCSQLKMRSSDGKRYNTDVATTEQLLRIIQSIPSKKAEPFKLWLAQVGRERIEETLDPELIAERLVSTYERRGYTPEWINQRLQAISARKELTDEWKYRGVKEGFEFAQALLI